MHKIERIGDSRLDSQAFGYAINQSGGGDACVYATLALLRRNIALANKASLAACVDPRPGVCMMTSHTVLWEHVRLEVCNVGNGGCAMLESVSVLPLAHSDGISPHPPVKTSNLESGAGRARAGSMPWSRLGGCREGKKNWFHDKETSSVHHVGWHGGRQ